MTKHLGITGSREGLTEEQRKYMRVILAELRRLNYGYLHHGDCVGVDEEVALYAKALGYRLVCHPPTDPKLRAHVPSQEVREAHPYLERNKHIVAASDMLLGFPNSPESVPRSGTWSTIKYARYHDVYTVVIAPDGGRSAFNHRH